MKKFAKIELEQKLKEARKEIEHYKKIAKETGSICLRETEALSQLILWRKQAEEELRENEERYRTVVEDMPAMICRFRCDGTLTFVNSAYCNYFNKKEEELIGQNLFQFILKEEQNKVKNHFMSLDQKRPTITYEHQVIAPDGEIRWQQWTDRALFDDQNHLVEYQSIGRDITEEKLALQEKNKLEAQLQQAHKLQAIGTLAGGFAHNFNNLLMGIIANISIMLLDIDSDHQHYKYLKNIEKQVENGSKLASQLTGYARVGRYKVKTINLNQLLKETSDTFKIAKKGIIIHQNFSDNLYGIEADRGQIEQVLLNLYINAADSMPKRGDLFLKTINVTDKDISGKPYNPKPGNYVLLTVRDTGAGMDKETREHIFEPFFTTKGLSKGTGLGLSSAYGIIKGHGGYIDVDSEKGYGATFNIYLPATKKEVKKEKELPGKIIKGNETVLLVDDEDMVVEGCREMLTKMGYNVSIARNGKDALEIYKENQDKIDIVIIDMIMPEMNGGDTYDRLKKMNPDINVLLSSGHSINGQATKILERGCNDFIQKPFNIEVLSEKIREILGKK
ncbi:MAG: response regulator [Deltaproteobacteria bacterium]|nr:response regulator [Deltaproteobacteria bacterium]MBW2642272.1 response regulator [Deltaproteobacteria bacterium]